MAELYEISFYLDSDYRLVKINWKNEDVYKRQLLYSVNFMLNCY